MTDENFTGPHRNTNQTKESISEILKSRRFGVNLDPDKIDDFAPNHVAQRIVANKAIREQVSLGADIYGEIKRPNEQQAHALYNDAFHARGENAGLAKSALAGLAMNVNGVANLRSERLNTQIGGRTIDYLRRDVKAARGEWTVRGGANGYGFGWQGNKTASAFAHLRSGITHTGGLIGEGMANTVGIITKQQRQMWKTGNPLVKSFAVAGPLIGTYTLGSTMLEGGDMGEALAFNASAAALLPGFHFGKSLASAQSSYMAGLFSPLKTIEQRGSTAGLTFGAAKHYKAGDLLPDGTVAAKDVVKGGKARLAVGIAGGILGGALSYAAVAGTAYAAQDLFSADSKIAEGARKFTSLTSSANITQNQGTLTMRQRALQQISQSAMNDRAQVLGSEASILKSLI